MKAVLTLSFIAASMLATGVRGQDQSTEKQAEFLDSALLDEMGVQDALSGRATIAGDRFDERNPEASRRAIDLVYGLGANFVSRFDNDAADKQAMRSEVYVTLGLDIHNPNDARVLEKISLELGLSFQNETSQLVDEDFDGSYSTGLTEKRARDVLNKLMLIANVYTIEGKGDWEVPIYVGVGRDDAAMIGSMIPQQLLITESALTTYSREQMDQVRVGAYIGKNTYVEANIYGDQWLGEYNTASLEGLEQDSDDINFAINVLHEIAYGKNRIGLKVSYINEGEGTILTRATDADQIGKNQTINLGASLTRPIDDVGVLYLGGEGLYIDPENSDEIWGAEAFAAIELDSGFTPFVDFTYFDRNDSSDWAVTLGLAMQVVKGLVVSAGIQVADQDGESSDPKLFVGASLGGKQERKIVGASE